MALTFVAYYLLSRFCPSYYAWALATGIGVQAYGTVSEVIWASGLLALLAFNLRFISNLGFILYIMLIPISLIYLFVL